MQVYFPGQIRVLVMAITNLWFLILQCFVLLITTAQRTGVEVHCTKFLVLFSHPGRHWYMLLVNANTALLLVAST